jgi:hypothetical protein
MVEVARKTRQRSRGNQFQRQLLLRIGGQREKENRQEGKANGFFHYPSPYEVDRELGSAPVLSLS